MSGRIVVGDCRTELQKLEKSSISTVVTSPPYLGLRDYEAGKLEIGQEETIEQFVSTLVVVFSEIKRVLEPRGVAWLNLGDSYSGSGRGVDHEVGNAKQNSNKGSLAAKRDKVGRRSGLVPGQMMLIPERVAIALQASGWIVRRRCIYYKRNAMPENVNSRPACTHEIVWMLSLRMGHYFDAQAVRTPYKSGSVARALRAQTQSPQAYRQMHAQQEELSDFLSPKEKVPGQTPHGMKLKRAAKRAARVGADIGRHWDTKVLEETWAADPDRGANLRDVWEMPTPNFSGEHFATFPEALSQLCIGATCPVGGTVLDPFAGSGTTGLAAKRMDRDYILIELNPGYAELARSRIDAITEPLFTTGADANE